MGGRPRGNKKQPSATGLSNIKMPEMDGFGLIRALGLDAGGSVPVCRYDRLFITGITRVHARCGLQACLPKPFTPDKLLETILAVIND
jgi:CheY-like chemotaxis protein